MSVVQKLVAHILNIVFSAQLFFNVIQSCVLCDHSTVCCESQSDWKLWLFSNCSLHNLFHNCTTTLWLIQLVNSRPLFALPVLVIYMTVSMRPLIIFRIVVIRRYLFYYMFISCLAWMPAACSAQWTFSE